MLVGASAGPWCLIGTSSVCVRGHSLSWDRDLCGNCTVRLRKPQLPPLLLNSLWRTVLFYGRRKATAEGLTRPCQTWEAVGIFPGPFGRNLSWLPPKSRATCSLISLFLSVPLCFAWALVALVKSLEGGAARRQIAVSPSVNFPVGGRKNWPCTRQVPSEGAQPPQASCTMWGVCTCGQIGQALATRKYLSLKPEYFSCCLGSTHCVLGAFHTSHSVVLTGTLEGRQPYQETDSGQRCANFPCFH